MTTAAAQVRHPLTQGVNSWLVTAPVMLATLSTSTLSREEMGNATGLFNMLRNIGGSIGIAMATTAIIRRSTYHQVLLGSNLDPNNSVFQYKSKMLAGYLFTHIGTSSPGHGALGMIYGLLNQQAAMKAYVDVFRWTALLAFFCAGAVWMFGKPPKHTEPPPGIH